ncbi:hypothetical protein [Agromyces aerolatus]|uniref:hypothetical protein n=1 Tax=Agromyces sp. LY-1074 TaxID=3074080 RepID=UPI00285757C7|nr:hypothetical protein [Agromyces sp. LY-1074]MDR5699937.1 hypothetical protein [Agromyces sp. LY-1074]
MGSEAEGASDQSEIEAAPISVESIEVAPRSMRVIGELSNDDGDTTPIVLAHRSEVQRGDVGHTCQEHGCVVEVTAAVTTVNLVRSALGHERTELVGHTDRGDGAAREREVVDVAATDRLLPGWGLEGRATGEAWLHARGKVVGDHHIHRPPTAIAKPVGVQALLGQRESEAGEGR